MITLYARSRKSAARDAPSALPPPGAPRPYRPEYAEEARSLCLLCDMGEEAVAKALRDPLGTLREWKATVPEFAAIGGGWPSVTWSDGT